MRLVNGFSRDNANPSSCKNFGANIFGTGIVISRFLQSICIILDSACLSKDITKNARALKNTLV
jgi:hypothetical protein